MSVRNFWKQLAFESVDGIRKMGPQSMWAGTTILPAEGQARGKVDLSLSLLELEYPFSALEH